MKPMQFTVIINASKEKVWDTLWQDKTLRDWAGLIDPGTYMVGQLKQGAEVQFISAENGYGVTSLVEKVTPNEYLLLSHEADTKESGTQEREKQWTGGQESYQLKENNSTTTLIVTFDVPPELKDYFNDAYPKALERVKVLTERATE